MSRDHDWGLRLNLLVDEAMTGEVDAYLAQHLPPVFEGLPTRYPVTWDPRPYHRVEVEDPVSFLTSRLGVNPLQTLPATAWLGMTGQSVLEVCSGPVFEDLDGRLTRARRRLRWYPDEVWAFVVAADWRRIGEELPLLGRAGFVGDDLGSRVIAARLVGVAMHLGFMLSRAWAPYPKWLGTMFADLPLAQTVLPPLERCLQARTWAGRQDSFVEALTALNDAQRETGLPTTASPVHQFWGRPFVVVADDVIGLLMDDVRDDDLYAMPLVGSVEQWCDNVLLLTDVAWRTANAAAGGVVKGDAAS